MRITLDIPDITDDDSAAAFCLWLECIVRGETEHKVASVTWTPPRTAVGGSGAAASAVMSPDGRSITVVSAGGSGAGGGSNSTSGRPGYGAGGGGISRR